MTTNQQNFRVRKGLTIDGSTSGSVSLTAAAVSGTQAYTLPTAVPAANGYVLASQTDGTLSWISNATIPNGTAQGQVLYWDGTDWVAEETVTSVVAANRLTARFLNSNNTATSSLRVNRDYDTYTYVTGDSTAIQYQIASDTQPVTGIGLTGFAYSATDPSFIAVTTTDNFTTRTTVMDVNGTDAKFDATILTLNYNLAGAATDAFYAVNRGSTGADVALKWNAATNKWQFTNDGTTYYDMVTSDTNTTYTINASSTTGGANFNLVGSDASTDTIAYLGSGATTVTRTDANTITISSVDTNTTYTVDATSTTGGANLNLVGSDSTTDTVAYLGSGATTVTRTDANTITISSVDTNTTYTQDVSSTTGGANLNLVGSDSTTDTVKFAGGTNVTVVATDASTVTINATDTNTTYDFNATSTTGGANLNLVGSDSTTDTVKLTNGGHITATYTSGTEVTLGSDATDANTAGTIVARDGSGNFSAGGATLGAVTVGIDTDQTVSTSSGNLILQTAAGVNAGTMTLTAGANGNITVAPNGTGSVALTLANGGNLTNTRNYVQGAIRNSTTAAAGEVFTLGPAGTGFKGISLDNSADTVDGPMTILRSFTGGAVAGAATRGRFVFERARGTSASPTAIQSADQLGSIEGTGYTSTGWLADTLAVQPAVFNFAAAENWVSNTNLGTTATLVLAPTATTISTGANLVPVITANPQTFACRSDAYTWSNGKTGTTQRMALDVSGNLTVSGDLTVTGNDIKNSGGSNVITMSSGNTQTDITSNIVYIKEPTTASTYGNASSVGINAGNPVAASFNDRISQFRVSTATTSGTEASTITFNTGRYNTGTNVFSATQSGDYLGEFFFAGNYGTTSGFTTLGPSVRFRATAAENFTATNSGGAFAINLDKIGGSTPYDAISVNSSNASIASDVITLEDSNNTDYVVFNSTSATFAQPVGFPVKTAAQWNAITGAVGQQVCVSNSPTVGGRMAFWDTTNSRWSYVSDNSAV